MASITKPDELDQQARKELIQQLLQVEQDRSFTNLEVALRKLALEQQVMADTERYLSSIIHEKGVASTTRSLVIDFEEAASHIKIEDLPFEYVSGQEDCSASSPDSISFETHWWGFQLHFPHSVMGDVDKAAGLIGGLTSALALVPGLNIAVGVLAASIAIRWAVMKVIDKGRGVTLTSPWVVLAALVPTPR
jgi:hypothetical protein